ncbi:hypothetical protein FQN57_002758 [Myotisia sp. PD_48]|nr:hypothetical protein FQN57_002758 [Myotisia sp. PD_48]
MGEVIAQCRATTPRFDLIRCDLTIPELYQSHSLDFSAMGEAQRNAVSSVDLIRCDSIIPVLNALRPSHLLDFSDGYGIVLRHGLDDLMRCDLLIPEGIGACSILLWVDEALAPWNWM